MIKVGKRLFITLNSTVMTTVKAPTELIDAMINGAPAVA
jgi:hypothetical protein